MARVLVVDDNLDQVHTLTVLLRLEGHTAEGRGDARKILDFVQEFKPDVIVLDLGLPEISGWEAAKQIKDGLGADSPVLIALTGEFTRPSDEARARTAGFDAYFVKPCDPKVLAQLIASASKPH